VGFLCPSTPIVVCKGDSAGVICIGLSGEVATGRLDESLDWHGPLESSWIGPRADNEADISNWRSFGTHRPSLGAEAQAELPERLAPRLMTRC
jgi:hypothetical protein